MRPFQVTPMGKLARCSADWAASKDGDDWIVIVCQCILGILLSIITIVPLGVAISMAFSEPEENNIKITEQNTIQTDGQSNNTESLLIPGKNHDD